VPCQWLQLVGMLAVVLMAVVLGARAGGMLHGAQ